MAVDSAPGTLEVVHRIPGRLRVRVPRRWPGRARSGTRTACSATTRCQRARADSVRWHVAHSVRGRLRVRYPAGWLKPRQDAVVSTLRSVPGVRTVDGSGLTGS